MIGWILTLNKKEYENFKKNPFEIYRRDFFVPEVRLELTRI